MKRTILVAAVAAFALAACGKEEPKKAAPAPAPAVAPAPAPAAAPAPAPAEAPKAGEAPKADAGKDAAKK